MKRKRKVKARKPKAFSAFQTLDFRCEHGEVLLEVRRVPWPVGGGNVYAWELRKLSDFCSKAADYLDSKDERKA